MIAVDTSAIVAIILEEPEAKAYAALMEAVEARVGGPTLAEARIVIETKAGMKGLQVLEEMIASGLMSVVPFNERHALAAHDAHRRFGKGRGHPAKLNICDCFSYAVAMCDDLPLLFKGDDFVHTDLAPACRP